MTPKRGEPKAREALGSKSSDVSTNMSSDSFIDVSKKPGMQS